MIELSMNQIEKDLSRLRIAIDGIWDGLSGMDKRFEMLESDIKQLIEENGFNECDIFVLENGKIKLFENANAVILQVINFHSSRAWSKGKIVAYGTNSKTEPVIDKIAEFLRQKVKFTVERKDK